MRPLLSIASRMRRSCACFSSALALLVYLAKRTTYGRISTATSAKALARHVQPLNDFLLRTAGAVLVCADVRLERELVQAFLLPLYMCVCVCV